MAGKRRFGTTWWGQEWIRALEGRAAHDENRLPRGRAYATRGNAGELQITPGVVSARVLGSRPEPYDVELYIRPFRDDEWDSVLDAIVAKAAHAAALLDGELSSGIAADAAEVEVDLLPRSGDLRTSCTCPDDAEPCKHAAAVCYLLADALDADAFNVLLLRGMHRDEVIAAIRRRRVALAAAAAEAAGEMVETDVEPVGLSAADGWSRELGPLPVAPRAVRTGPAKPAPWPSDPPADAPFGADGLRRLATDAARRAWAVRVGDDDSGLGLDRDADIARRADIASETERRAMASRAGMSPAQLNTAAVAWHHGGLAGLRAEHEPSWPASPLEMARAQEAIIAAGWGRRAVRVRSNRVTVDGDHQFRRSRDGRWYFFTKDSGGWLLAAPPADELDDLLAH